MTKDGQQLASEVLLGLQALGASETCITEAAPFLCLYAYGLCSSTGVYIQPTLSQCVEVRDNLCSLEWTTALNFDIALPDCNQFAFESQTCMVTSNDIDSVNTSTETIEGEIKI